MTRPFFTLPTSRTTDDTAVPSAWIAGGTPDTISHSPTSGLTKAIKNHLMHFLIFMVGIISFSGCVYKGAKVTEGTDLAIGLNVPVSEGTLQLQVLNYLSGFRLGVDKNAVLKCKYTVAETNSYLGVVHTCVTKTVDATVEPCETTSCACTTNACACAAE